MRKCYTIIGIILCLIFILLAVSPNQSYANNEDPPYAKWGRIAMQETKSKYPNVDIVDYLHVGRKVNNGSATETFKLWLRQKNGREFGVFTTIEFNVKTERVIKVSFRETSR